MKSEWRLEKCSKEPDQFKQLSPNIWIQRRNIRKAPDTLDGEDGGYECESRRISSDVYEAIEEERDSVLAQLLNDSKESNDDISAALLLNQIEIQQTQEMQDDVLAEILLNQIGGTEHV